jgi:hypothetical protein
MAVGECWNAARKGSFDPFLPARGRMGATSEAWSFKGMGAAAKRD